MSSAWIPKEGKSSDFGVDYLKVKHYQMPPFSYDYTERDIILYALGVGAGGSYDFQQSDPTKPEVLAMTYENNEDFSPLPSFGVVPPFQAIIDIVRIPGLKFNPMMLLHGETHLILNTPSSAIPLNGKLTTHAHISQVLDKKSAASIEITAYTVDESSQLTYTNIMTMFIRGIGGFTSKFPNNTLPAPSQPAPTTYSTTACINKLLPVPGKDTISPSYTYKDLTTPQQALLYRLSGDRNPLHIDPQLAKLGGFTQPILHGLCTFGFTTRAILHSIANNNKDSLTEIKVRFVKPVYPGQAIETQMWVFKYADIIPSPSSSSSSDSKYYVIFQTITLDNHTPVLIGNCILDHLDKNGPAINTVAPPYAKL